MCVCVYVYVYMSPPYAVHQVCVHKEERAKGPQYPHVTVLPHDHSYNFNIHQHQHHTLLLGM